MLTPFDDYPVHQTALPLAHAGDGHPDHYDRFWFNGYQDDFYFGVAMATYANRGIIDAAISVVHDGHQRSVFASGRLPMDPTVTRVGPITIELTEPLRVNRVLVDAAELGIGAELTYRARTAAIEEPRQTRLAGNRPVMDVTRLTQWGTWTGRLEVLGEPLDLGSSTTFATKDRSWGIRPVGLPAPGAPSARLPQIFFLWAPLHFARSCVHFMVFEDEHGEPWVQSAAVLPVIGDADPVFGPDLGITECHAAGHAVRWAPGLRRSDGARLTIARGRGESREPAEDIELEPLLTFRMRGIGYGHPEWGHGRWHDELAVGAEDHLAKDLDSLDPSCVHVQQVMRATWAGERGLGVLEQVAFGPHAPSGWVEFLDGGR